MTVLQLVTAEGLTQASRVIELESLKSVASLILTKFDVPLKDNAPWYFPLALKLTGPLIVPVWPLPVRSIICVPDPSLKLYDATNPPIGEAVGEGEGEGEGLKDGLGFGFGVGDEEGAGELP